MTASAVLLAACAIPGTRPAEPKRLVFVALGASDAVGVGASGPDQSWVADLHRKLPPGSKLVNLGISGEKLHEALDDELPVAVNANPDVVTVWLVVNDINARRPLDQYERDLDTMLGRLETQTHARIVVGNVPDLSAIPAYGGIDHAALADEINRWNAAISRQVNQHGATLVDLHGTWQELSVHPEYVGADGFHPSAEGYSRLADVFYAVMMDHHLI
jgi:lysophospholipase L1-like esterase